MPSARSGERAMVAAAWSGAADADVVALLIDAGMRLEGDTRRIIDGLKQNEARAVCVLNKIDTVPRENLLALIEELRAEDLFTDFFMVSALKGEGVLCRAFAEGPLAFSGRPAVGYERPPFLGRDHA